jgi:hypothetical protein
MKIASLITAAAVVALLSPAPAHAQGLPRDPAERAKAIAQILEANARQLTLFDRQGQSVGVVGRGTCTNSRCSRPTASGWPSSRPTSTRKPTTCGSSTSPAREARRSPPARCGRA